MKNTIFILISVLILASCNEKRSTKNLQITGYIKGLQKGTLYIQKIIDTNLVAIDTIKIDGNSNFSTQLNIQSPEMYYLFLDRGVSNSKDNNLTFFAEAGHINIESSLENFLNDARITGSKNNDYYVEYRKIYNRFNDENLNLTEAKFNAYKNHNQKKLDSLLQKQSDNTKRRYLYTVNFAINHKEYEIAPFVTLSDINDVNFKYLDTIQKSISHEVAQSIYGKKLKELYEKRKLEEVNKSPNKIK